MAQNPAVVTPRGHSRFKHDPQAAPRVRQANPGVTAGSHVTSPLPKGDKNSMTIEGSNVIDESGDKVPTIPPAPEQPVLPVDDPFRKMRLSKA